MIKNYVVKSERVKNGYNGLHKFVIEYLFDKEHPNHKNKETEIIRLVGDEYEFFKLARAEAETAEIAKLQKRKGGKPNSNYAMSYSLNFPPTVKLNEREIRNVLLGVYKDLAEFLSVEPKKPKMRKLKKGKRGDKVRTPEEQEKAEKNFAHTLTRWQNEIDEFKPMSFEELRDSSFAVLHDQENQHVHFTLPTFRNGKSNQAIKSPAFLKLMKASFTLHTDKIAEVNFEEYKRNSQGKNYTKKSLAVDKKVADLSVAEMQKYLDVMVLQKPDDKLLNGAVADLAKGKTIKASDKIKKYIEANCPKCNKLKNKCSCGSM